MGVYIGLDILPGKIDRAIWHDVYQESLTLLQAWPAGIMGMRHQSVADIERRVYSRWIEHNTDNSKQRHWHVVGDFESRERGESFALYYDPSCIAKFEEQAGMRANANTDDADILTCLAEEKPGARSLFNNKTQGHPYHIPLLAVAMLIEDRFPGLACTNGDIDIDQARRAQELVKTLLSKCPRR